MALVSSLWLVSSHVACYTNPPIQQRIIRVLLIVPVYACQSWLALMFKDYALYFDLLRDSYESFVIYEFFALLKSYMGGDAACLQKLRAQPRMAHLFPFCHLAPFRQGSFFLRTIYICLLQYVVIKPLTACLAMVLHRWGLYTEGAIANPADGYLWITVIVNISVTVAFTSLVYFYVATKNILADQSPTWKFVVVKSVVFLSFWQSVIVAILLKCQVIQEISNWSPEEVGMGLQELLISVEMMFVSVACHYIFSYYPYRPPKGRSLPSSMIVSHAVSPRVMVKDYVSDITCLLDGHLSSSGMFPDSFHDYAEQIMYADQYGTISPQESDIRARRQRIRYYKQQRQGQQNSGFCLTS
mmetsp:Transcript_73559/g.129655  ORF Transcript_73559/g.129655 Transcript_73559/m.129655 type:complete len:356 (-) Transcript_73559:580-1647(-)